MEEAAASLGAGPVSIFRRIVFPNLLPAILSGIALALARAVGEFGAVVLISGSLPFETKVAAVNIFGRIEGGDPVGAAAVSVVLLVISFGILLTIGAFQRWAAGTMARRAAFLRFVGLGYLAVILIAPVSLVFWRAFEDGVGRPGTP